MTDNNPLVNPVLSSRSDKSLSKKQERKSKYADLAIQGTNNSSIASKRSVELLYLPKLNKDDKTTKSEYFKWFVPKNIKRSPCINRGYWLRLHAIRSRLKSILESNNGKKLLVINLGCGFDPLPFELLDRSNKSAECFQDTISFIDVDYSDLLVNKIKIIENSQELSQIITREQSSHISEDTLITKNYRTAPCDLNDSQAFEILSQDESLNLNDTNVIKIFIAEVSLAYMKPSNADGIISICSKIPNSHFVILEQLIPEGPYEPFAKQMLKHFRNNDSPLQSVLTYPTINSQLERFKKLGFPIINAGDMLNLWKQLPLETRSKIETIQPFDELEEFHLFAHHYILLHATNDTLFRFTDDYKFPSQVHAPLLSERSLKIKLTHEELNIKRSFGSSYVSKGTKNQITYHGGCNPTRLNETLIITPLHTEGSPSEEGYQIQTIKNDDPNFKKRMNHTFVNGIIIGGREAPHRPIYETIKFNGNSEYSYGMELPHGIERHRHCAVNVSENEILVFGGKVHSTPDAYRKDAFLSYDISKDEYTEVPYYTAIHTTPPCLIGSSMSYDKERNIGVILGGQLFKDDSFSDKLYKFSYCSRKKEITILDVFSNPLFQRYGSKCVFINDHQIMIVGGTSPEIVFNDRTTIITVDILTAKINSIPIPRNIWEESQVFLVGFELLKISETKVLIFAGGATCYGFGSVSNVGIEITLPST
ncbi:tRNA methyltransferase PPM2 NDAI_0G03760 [Naumovozyma dairenensis CBS 421]|uniref:tRNA wybutosine-synthesizing protein 4 n=1 Tax=Naumovozyma dairenensis (strain ATCC 10597 / BCRC 20456 / CBS 421 / NBRC 0211 / NRRL Y-12639) TaxID=1071378 RepID=G0WEE2_NAUDC|nr:hypothetical protein NDAI_0G03760 [Naumovozyma dairenensis CBS 421]CCD26153.2 hypothetical protein NDAI_0G03760 [Naumovozyma dairenensis CBS 421]